MGARLSRPPQMTHSRGDEVLPDGGEGLAGGAAGLADRLAGSVDGGEDLAERWSPAAITSSRVAPTAGRRGNPGGPAG
jgi:hypothetical protein